jgi:hypothetical protein
MHSSKKQHCDLLVINDSIFADLRKSKPRRCTRRRAEFSPKKLWFWRVALAPLCHHHCQLIG